MHCGYEAVLLKWLSLSRNMAFAHVESILNTLRDSAHHSRPSYHLSVPGLWELVHSSSQKKGNALQMLSSHAEMALSEPQYGFCA